MVEFKLPDVGEGMHEGEILRWLVKPGEAVKLDQPILEVQTDKVNAELTSPVSGVVDKIMFAEGDVVEVGTTLMLIATEDNAATATASVSAERPGQGTVAKQTTAAGHGSGESGNGVPAVQTAHAAAQTTQAAHAASQTAHPAQPTATPRPLGQAASAPNALSQAKPRVTATPYVRQMAREMQIDIEQVTGTGPAGRVTEDDLRRFANAGQASAGAQGKVDAVTVVAPAGSRSFALAESAGKQSAGAIGREKETRIPLKGIRKKIAEHLVKSVTIIPHVTHVDELEMDALRGLRERLRPHAEARGVKLTYLPFFIKALIVALKEYPTLNASIDDGSNEIVLKNYYNIGIATDTEDGLIVPVVKDADQKTIFQLAEEISRLAQQAREGKLSLAEITGGTFTISNVGPIGGLLATPIINHPEAAILGLHKLEQRMVVREGEGVVRWMMNLSLSFDHRLIDGVTAVRFTNRMRQLLENPELLLAELV